MRLWTREGPTNLPLYPPSQPRRLLEPRAINCKIQPWKSQALALLPFISQTTSTTGARTKQRRYRKLIYFNKNNDVHFQEDLRFCRFSIFERAGMPKKSAFMPACRIRHEKIGIHAGMPKHSAFMPTCRIRHWSGKFVRLPDFVFSSRSGSLKIAYSKVAVLCLPCGKYH